jgi:hypothetical protein
MDPYGGHGIIQQHHIVKFLQTDSNLLKICQQCAIVMPAAAQKVA